MPLFIMKLSVDNQKAAEFGTDTYPQMLYYSSAYKCFCLYYLFRKKTHMKTVIIEILTVYI